MTNPKPLCHIDDITDPGAKGFEIQQVDQQTLSFFIVKKDAQVYAYKNECPHARVNLEWQEDDFLDMDKALIQCSVHGALFIIESGDCAGGPCNGQGLQSLNIRTDDEGMIFLDHAN